MLRNIHLLSLLNSFCKLTPVLIRKACTSSSLQLKPVLDIFVEFHDSGTHEDDELVSDEDHSLAVVLELHGSEVKLEISISLILTDGLLLLEGVFQPLSKIGVG